MCISSFLRQFRRKTASSRRIVPAPMASTTNVFITGVGKGIGKALAEVYLSRPNHVVIGSVRDVDAAPLKDFKAAAGSRLILVKIEATSESDASEAAQTVRDAGITSLDILIANAGMNPPSAFAPVANVKVEDMRHLFEVNTFSFVSLFNAFAPFLQATVDKKGPGSSPKLLGISSNAASIQDLLPAPVTSYGASKLVLNYLVRHIHLQNPWLTAWVMNPGFVQTDTGYAGARAAGMEKPPHTIEESVAGLMQKLDSATREETSGGFYNFDGTVLRF
ncbi:putative aflatoxin biosynthesis ketoreductase nor-1 [Xylaria sp. CBS 124048]|nr:putative aflatoxin biosynthesis ketoreductase nor-1 [Xylaria sp. CBS 124048]